MIYCTQWQPKQKLQFYTSRSKKKASILEDFISLDTETSHNHDDENPIGWVYQWAFAFANDEVVVGRKPSELLDTLDKIVAFYELDEKHKVVIYVHNLSYDLNYLVNFLIDRYGTNYTQISPESHKFTSFSIGAFEFKCSYMLSRSSLDKWGKDYDTKYKKLTGAIDYNIIRYQDSELEAIDWDYMVGDVLTLRYCLKAQFKAYNDTIASVPLTATGYIRREERNNYKKDIKNRRTFLDTQLDIETYLLSLRAFSGAYTHGNRFLAGLTLRVEELSKKLGKAVKIKHRDFRSHYPSNQRVAEFPIGRFNLIKSNATIKDVLIFSETYCELVDITIKNVRLKKGVTAPYLQVSKCYEGRDRNNYHAIEDNGRILQIKGATRIVLTELDIKIVLSQYEIEGYYIHTIHGAIKGKLPKFIIETIDNNFLGKTQYKIEEKNATDKADKLEAHINLMRSKAQLNAIYGCTAQKPVRSDFIYNNGEWEKEILTPELIEKKLAEYYKNYNSFNRYQLGVWTTSNARFELMEYLINAVGYNNYIYADTDSLFYISTPEVEARIEALNKKKEEEALKIGAYIEYNNKRVTYDSFDDEEEEITAFRFLHSKCYGYEVREDNNTALKLTIAGVTAFYREDLEKPVKERRTREDELGSLDNLKSGFVFKHCGGTSISYPPRVGISKLNINGHITEVGSCAIIKEVTKTLNFEYARDDNIIYSIS